METSPQRVHVCTAVTRTCLAHARVLAESFVRHHPGDKLTLLLIDDGDSSVDSTVETFELVRPSALALDREEFHRMAAIYPPDELACALKPWALRYLLDTERAHAIWLDADLQLFAPLESLLEAVRTSVIVLTPRLLELQTRKPSHFGLFNAGIVAVGAGSRPFLDWWGDCLRRHAINRPATSHFFDQSWLDYVPCHFPGWQPHRDPAYNVAKWNLDERELVWTGSRYEAKGIPLVAFHYAGLRFGTVGFELPSAVSEHPAASRLYREYVERLRAHGLEEFRHLPYGYARSASGVELTRNLRRFLHEVLLLAEKHDREPWPDPFARLADEQFGDWLRRPAVRRAAALRGLDRYGRARRVLRRGGRRLLNRRWEYHRELADALFAATEPRGSGASRT